jgi:iron complex transport system substrate-binding protein
MRIVSLLASGTEIAFALGRGDAVVGISHECDYPPEALDRPRVSRPRFDPTGRSSAEIDAAVREARATQGGVYELDAELLRRLEPDLILAQAVCEVCAVPTSLAAAAGRVVDPAPRVLSLDAHSLDGILEAIRRVGIAAEATGDADALVRRARARLEAVRAAVADRPAVTVLAIEWLSPPFLPGHWTPEMIELAGGRVVGGAAAGRPSRQVAWADLEPLDPDVVIVMPCGYDLTAARADADAHADALLRTAPRAAAAERVWVVDGSAYFNRSGPRAVDGVEILGAMLHPDRFPDSGLAGRAEVWTPPR